ncbi:unnamed protein product (macronuclear) [Paramecium tetraurelia]|uniref:Metallo-beta-lactamase domain-containing protein n=1 Tax=Paramecium tetraurelia TaxID=5888 RepID=A0DJC9_PARTE|nr:uncharacterized protein GSPATT00017490001 [Paramecium tetraurelia]CAK83146.1 unnamed protein product [Paramecium tetraurelia]|eukprot:XP_001450543.1 hypothetical protein (macronuclear) [Paramecium tetraurelia strain d4-2]
MILIPGYNPGQFTLKGTNTYLMGTGKARILIDTGEGKEEYKMHLKQIVDNEQCEITIVLITHHHHDHIGGISQVLELFPNSQVYKNLDHNLESDKLYPFKPLQDGQIFQVENCTITAISLPGHCVDHFGFMTSNQEWFSGDCLLGGSSCYMENVKQYLQSMEKIQNMNIKAIYPGHGYTIIEGAQEAIQNQIQHRKNREQQIYQVINGQSIEEIKNIVYPDSNDGYMRKVVKITLQAHLNKLIEDKLVICKDDLFYKC